MQGKLIIIEAGDGSGKATQTKLLLAALLAAGRKVRQVSFPDYESDSSALVRMYLEGRFGQQADAVNAYAASVFFAVDRYASYRLKWQSFYESGGIVLADRYTTSNMVHQAVKITEAADREAFLAWLYDFEFVKLGLPVPDLVLYLDMEPEASDRLIALRSQKEERPRDIHEQDLSYLHRCHQAYGLLAAKYGWRRIVCSRSGVPLAREEIHENILRAVEQALYKEKESND